MFDEYASSHFSDFPEFDGLTRDEIARRLSRAYLKIIELRIGNRGSDAEVSDLLSFLRRLVNVMLFHVVLRTERTDNERKAGAFVAAEALALLSDYIRLLREKVSAQVDPIHHDERFPRIEAALLYLYAEYDACAAGVLTLADVVLQEGATSIVSAASWCFQTLERFCKMKLNPRLSTEHGVQFRNGSEVTPLGLERDTLARLYAEVGIAVAEFATWLIDRSDSNNIALTRLDRLIDVLGRTAIDGVEPRRGHDYAKIYHLSVLLRLCLPPLGGRALVHTVPCPPDADDKLYAEYLRSRALGVENSFGRPVLWPSAREYVEHCIKGETKHAVVAMPTGSGKSFVGELAVSQAIATGWALYLAPTNALAEQIRGDLKQGLRSLNVKIMAFIGDQEYSIFTTDAVQSMDVSSVAVMTPEKCALALRLSPEAFQNCKLVVFDECHLIGDAGSSRGPVAELVISQLILRAKGCRFLLMSAIVQNPDELASWLQEATGIAALPVAIRWRPTRTLRSALGVADSSFKVNSKAAVTELSKLGDHRKKFRFTAKCAVAAGLQGAWKTTDEIDYAVSAIGCDADLSVHREKTNSGEWKYTWNDESWVNGTAVNLAKCLASSGIQTLVFTPASRHYPFANAKKLNLGAELLGHLPPRSDWVETCLTLAEFELGCPSEVGTLLKSGVAVHTSLMLETEKFASESMFKSYAVPVMFATGTLAQGLNLPALAVVIAGTRIGDPRGQDKEVVEQRKFSQLLNAAGRAGRAGFANQGIVITVPDDVVSFQTFTQVLAVRRQLDFLQKADDAVSVGSGLDTFLDELCKNALGSEMTASDMELQVTALLAGGDEKQPKPAEVLRASYAAFRRRKAGLPDISEENVQHLIDVKEKFIKDTGAPEWLTIAAQRAGLDFFVMFGIYKAWRRVRPTIPEDASEWPISTWTSEFMGAMANVPPSLIRRHLLQAHLERPSAEFKAIFKLQPQYLFERDNEWDAPKKWLSAWKSLNAPLEHWMSGASIASFAAKTFGIDRATISPERSQNKPIPKALGIVFETWSALSLFAGGFLAIAEQIFESNVPLPLACLPMCIKYGCDSPGTLGWFRFGVRLRRPSKILAQAFPPPQVNTDEELRDWVRKQRRLWINGSQEVPDAIAKKFSKELDAVRAFLKFGSRDF